MKRSNQILLGFVGSIFFLFTVMVIISRFSNYTHNDKGGRAWKEVAISSPVRYLYVDGVHTKVAPGVETNVKFGYYPEDSIQDITSYQKGDTLFLLAKGDNRDMIIDITIDSTALAGVNMIGNTMRFKYFKLHHIDLKGEEAYYKFTYSKLDKVNANLKSSTLYLAQKAFAKNVNVDLKDSEVTIHNTVNELTGNISNKSFIDARFTNIQMNKDDNSRIRSR